MLLYVLVGLLITFFLLSFTQFEIRDNIQINASIEQVWNVIIDFKSYDQWNSQLEYLSGEIKPAGTLHLRLTPPDGSPYEFKPTISHWKENEIFAWIAITGIPRLFDGEHFFELKKIDEYKTEVINREEYRGVISLIMKQLPMMKSAPLGFKKMNLELKAYCES